MSLVNADTGELLCTADEARTITDRIKVAVEATWQLIADAYTRGAHIALGYASWDDYCTREFGTARLRLPREDRTEVVMSLHHAGLSMRAIAAVTGDSKSTIADELQGVQNRTPCSSEEAVEKPRTIGRDGISYSPTKTEWTEARAIEFLDKYESATPSGKHLIASAYGLTIRSAESTAVRLRKQFDIQAKTGAAASAEKRDRIRELASTSMTSDQIGAEVGLTGKTVRVYASEMGIEIAADKVVSRVRRIDADRVVQAIVDKAFYDYASDSVLAAIDFADLDREQLPSWVDSLSDSIRSLTTLKNQLKKELSR